MDKKLILKGAGIGTALAVSTILGLCNKNKPEELSEDSLKDKKRIKELETDLENIRQFLKDHGMEENEDGEIPIIGNIPDIPEDDDSDDDDDDEDVEEGDDQDDGNGEDDNEINPIFEIPYDPYDIPKEMYFPQDIIENLSILNSSIRFADEQVSELYYKDEISDKEYDRYRHASAILENALNMIGVAYILRFIDAIQYYKSTVERVSKWYFEALEKATGSDVSELKNKINTVIDLCTKYKKANSDTSVWFTDVEKEFEPDKKVSGKK